MEFSRSRVHCLRYNAGTAWSRSHRSNSRVDCPFSGLGPGRWGHCLGMRSIIIFWMQIRVMEDCQDIFIMSGVMGGDAWSWFQ